MSEYQEKHSVAKLIGAPPGYVGFDDNAGQLITKIQENPNCVLLLDEIEKAHQDVSNVLLQLMDNGQVTGSNGKIADCRNIVLILTSNLGAKDAERQSIGFSKEDNRLDAIVQFNRLSKSSMKMIVNKFINELQSLIKDKSVTIYVSESGMDLLVERGFDPKMGARPLARIIDQDIKKPLSKELLFGRLKQGGSVLVDASNKDVILKI